MCTFFVYSAHAAQQTIVSGTAQMWQSEQDKINDNFTEVYGLINRNFSKLNLTADTVLTETQIRAYRFISNQGDTGEADIQLPDVEYVIEVMFNSEEAQVMEINPPTGELVHFNGTALDVNDVIDSPGAVGDKLLATRHQIADASWVWSLDAVIGTWADSGATD